MSEYKKGNTKLFNIRIPEYLHLQFKEWCAENDVSMASILLGHIEALVEGKIENPNTKSKSNAEFDPLSDLRTQYKDGVDF